MMLGICRRRKSTSPVESIRRLQLNPGEVLVVRARRRLTPEIVEQLRNGFEGLFPDNKVVIVEEIDLAVVRTWPPPPTDPGKPTRWGAGA